MRRTPATICVENIAAQAAVASALTQLDHLGNSGRRSTSAGDRSSRSEINLRFVIDEDAKTLTFADGRALVVTRLDSHWIGANSDDIFYEYDRQGRTLSYASSATKDSVTTTTIIGSGRCETMGG